MQPNHLPLAVEVARRVYDLVAARQRDWRSPGLSAALVRDGRLVHSVHVGSAQLDPPSPADDHTQFMIGSVTKTFTAVVVMALRDEGRLALDDPIGRHLPGLAHGELSIRHLLSHLSGLQREPVGRVWESLDNPDADRLLGELADAERVLPPHAHFHYSNLAFAVLGQLIERLEGRPWEYVVRARILDPLGMHSTGLTPGEGRARGYLVHPFSGVAAEEPLVDLRATAPMGGLWSTTADLARYAAFVASPDAAVLAADTLTEMCRPHVILDPDAWTLGYGLSFGMVRRGERIYVGHGGAMPGFLTGLRVSRADRLGAVVWANTSANAEPIVLAADLLDLVLAAEPTRAAAWVPEQPAPLLQELLGSWWSEGEELVFSVRQGRLWCAVRGGPALSESRFTPDGTDRFRVDQGRELGEALEVVRDDSGAVTKLYLATYAVTREPLTFAPRT
ncbi:MAG: serine hydrolase domain-containing protein [Candidatus Phosphoribacter sp.]